MERVMKEVSFVYKAFSMQQYFSTRSRKAVKKHNIYRHMIYSINSVLKILLPLIVRFGTSKQGNIMLLLLIFRVIVILSKTWLPAYHMYILIMFSLRRKHLIFLSCLGWLCHFECCCYDKWIRIRFLSIRSNSRTFTTRIYTGHQISDHCC